MKKILFTTLAIGSVTLFSVTKAQLFYFPQSQGKAMANTAAATSVIASIPGISSTALKTATAAYLHAKHDGDVNKNLMMLVDYSKPSYNPRLWVLSMTDPNHPSVVYNGYVAHGSGSGDVVPTYFSNGFSSHASSLGAFVTYSAPYYGKHGYSLRVKGLEPGVNNNAEARSVVIHGGWYVSPEMAEKSHRLGRSWGCFAVDPKQTSYLVNLLKGGSFIFAYAQPELDDSYVKFA